MSENVILKNSKFPLISASRSENRSPKQIAIHPSYPSCADEALSIVYILTFSFRRWAETCGLGRAGNWLARSPVKK